MIVLVVNQSIKSFDTTLNDFKINSIYIDVILNYALMLMNADYPNLKCVEFIEAIRKQILLTFRAYTIGMNSLLIIIQSPSMV